MASVALFRGPTGALFAGTVKGSPALVIDGVAKMSSDARPGSETGRKSTMANVAGDVSSIPRLTAMKRGGGFRSSFSGRVATVFGATGSLGRVVCNRLGKQGNQMVIPYRGDHYAALPLKVCGDLGQVLFSEYNLKDEESIRTAMKYSDVVINLIGREWETRNFNFRDVNVEGPRMLARLAREAGVRTFIHISHINAREKPQAIWSKGSEFLKTKWQGENAVLEEFPDATIFRPVEMVGVADWFCHYYTSRLRFGFTFRTIPLWKKGNYCIKQPLSYSNMADAIMASLDDPFAKGKVFDAMGKHRYLLSDILDFMNEVMDRNNETFGYKRTDIRLDPSPLIKAYMMEKLVLGQKYTRGHSLERLERTMLTEESDSRYDITDLGVHPADIQLCFAKHLEVFRMYRMSSYHWTDCELIPLNRVEEAKVKQEDQEGSAIVKAIGL